MRLDPASYVAPPHELASLSARFFPEYVSAIETGPAASTDLRACWIKPIRHLPETMGHQYGVLAPNVFPAESQMDDIQHMRVSGPQRHAQASQKGW